MISVTSGVFYLALILNFYPAVMFTSSIILPAVILGTCRFLSPETAVSRAKRWLALFWTTYGRIWHGYEIEGLEAITSLEKPVLFIFYHGAIGVDLGIFLNHMFLEHNQSIHIVSDKFLHTLSFYKASKTIQNCVEGSREECLQVLKNGNSLIIAPGGSYEAMFGSNDYELLWRNRIGFAKIAQEAQVDIVPVFTRNIQEAFRPVPFCKNFMMKLYLRTRIPLTPMFGGFPVKLKTFVGEPIKVRADQTPQDIRNEVEKRIKNMIAENQYLPGSILKAMLERF